MSFIMVRSVLGTAGHSLLKPSIVRMSSIVLSHRSRMFSNLPTSSHSLPIAQHSPAVQALPLSTSNASQLSTASSGIFTTQTSSTPTSLIHSYQAAPFSTSVTPAATAATAGTTANAGPQKGTENNQNENQEDQFSWIDKEAHELILKAYARHKALADKSQSFPPSLSATDLERIGVPYHYEPKDFSDRVALRLMKVLRVFVHAFFREKYDHHAVCLETVAAIPGMVASFHRHFRSLRRMKRDHGWITVLQEEAENERMHLLIFMKVCKPTLLERGLVMMAQGVYLTFYSALYMLHSRTAHRLTGYLEEEAHAVYTDYLQCLESGKLRNGPAPNIAKQYYHLPDDASMRDVVLHIRADEAMHRDVNHQFGNMYTDGRLDEAIDHSPK